MIHELRLHNIKDLQILKFKITIFQKLIATNHSNLVRNLTILYFLSSLLIFSVSVQVGSVFSLVVSLLCVEFLTWALTHKMNKDFQ